MPNKQNTPSSSYFEEEDFNFYLAGFIEGDGSFNTPKVIRDTKGKKRVAGIEITGNTKDEPFFIYLQKKIGGHINIPQSKKNTIRLMIKDLNSVINIINRINGKLKTPKITRLHLTIIF